MGEIYYDSEVLDDVCEQMFGHTDWEYVDNKILRRHDDENYTVVLFHHEDTREEEHNPETCDECIVARERGDMDKQGYEE